MNFIEEVKSDKSIIDEYFRLYNIYANKYGKSNTILLLQVGSFHEAYQTLEEGFNLQKISDVLNIIVSRKNKSISEISNKNPYMLGFPSLVLNKFLKILIDNGYTVVIGDQITPPPNPKRAITNIYSPATYLDDTTPDIKTILSIYIEDVKNTFLIGLAVIDLTTGKSTIYEVYSEKDDEKICLDETIKFMYSFQAKEIIVTSNILDKSRIDSILSYLEITDKLFYHQTITQTNKSLFKLSYQQEILKKIYPASITGLLTPIEYLDLEQLSYARLAFIILLNYAYDHSHNIINNLAKPELYSRSKFLNLGNNAIFQLNILTFDKTNSSNIYNEKTQFKSLFDVLNKTITSMGRRMLKENLSQPLIDSNIINSRYNFIKDISGLLDGLESKLIGINDIERLNRKVNLSIINPIDFYTLIQSIDLGSELFNFILNKNLILNNFNFKDILTKTIELLIYINKYFRINELNKYLINDISGPIFNKNIFKDIDSLSSKIDKCYNYMNAIGFGLTEALDKFLGTTGSNAKVESTDREGHYIVLTKRRAEVLEKILKDEKIIKFNYENILYEIKEKDLEFRHLPKGNSTKIFIKEMENNSLKMIEYTDQLKILQKENYIKILNSITNKYDSLIETIHIAIANIDFLFSGAKVANKYHYTIPTINNKFDSKSYFIAKALRHPIIELINTEKEYIPTDIELGISDKDGILLFGLNSAGKSSLQKSIGIAIIMAQIGYPVPATSFEYNPYHSCLTRISANDNLFKGLSSFALEIAELRAIIKRSNKNTLVIADEVCKGTEHKSSLIIVLTMLEILSKNKTSFITATHLHDIVSIPRLSNLTNIKMYHLHVDYDEENNIITYDRVLKEGSGDNFYGLNVAKYLIADDKFMNLATTIKKDIFELPDLLNLKSSNYNSDLYMDKCQICDHKPKKSEIPLETHHIIFQKDFKNNSNKFHIQKNQKSNLVVLCQKCHDDIDRNKIIVNGWKDNNLQNKLNWIKE